MLDVRSERRIEVPRHDGLAACLGLAGLLVAGCDPEPGPTIDYGPVVIGLHAEAVSSDPHLQSEAVSLGVLSSVYESLVSFDTELRVAPQLAERWSSPDSLTWRLDLRDDVIFHDGRRLSADDVVFSLERAQTLPGTRVAGLLGGVTRIEAPDSRTVVLTTDSPNPILLNKLAFVLIVPHGAPARIDRPIGTGPYRWVGNDEGNAVELEAFADYWGTPASEPRIRFRFLPEDEDRLQGLLTGELALVTRVQPKSLARLRDSERAKLVSRPGLSTVLLQLRVDKPPLDDVRVREAISLSLDRRRLVVEDLGGEGEPVGQPLSPLVFGYAPDVPVPERDLARARELLNEAGYPDGIELVLEHREGRDYGLVVEQLREAGFEARSQPSPWRALYPRILAGEVSFCVFAWISSPGDASDVLDALVHTPESGSGYGDANWSGFSDLVLDELIERSRLQESTLGRQRLLQEAVTRTASQHFLIPLYVLNDLYGVRQDVEWEPRLDGRLLLGDLKLRRP